MTERECYNARREMLDHLGDLLRTQVLKKEKELIEKQLEEAERQGEGDFFYIYRDRNRPSLSYLLASPLDKLKTFPIRVPMQSFS